MDKLFRPAFSASFETFGEGLGRQNHILDDFEEYSNRRSFVKTLFCYSISFNSGNSHVFFPSKSGGVAQSGEMYSPGWGDTSVKKLWGVLWIFEYAWIRVLFSTAA